MKLDSTQCYRALCASDARFDGVFFVGVSSTGIYCRPICPAKTPKPENCTFYRSQAAAEREGYRPCLRCRPELAPKHPSHDEVNPLAAQIAARIAEGALSTEPVSALAAEFGIGERQLRRIITTQYGASPVELAQTYRLLLAKRLLTDTNLSITDVAFSAGFGSLRRFHTLFQSRYRMNPSETRKTQGATPSQTPLTFELSYRYACDWKWLFGFLAGRATTGVEIVQDGVYRRTLYWEGLTGWLSVQPNPERNLICIEISTSLAPKALAILAKCRALFDLNAPLETIEAHLADDPIFTDSVKSHSGLRVPGATNGFEVAVRAILGQQVSVRSATTLAGRLAAKFGEPIETSIPELNRLTPTPERILQAELQEIIDCGIIQARARTIVGLAKTMVEDNLLLEPGVDVAATIQKLVALPGIGDWTANVVAMRAMRYPDAFPYTDLGVYKALNERNPKKVLAMAEAWRPWRAYATLHLWQFPAVNGG